MTCRHGLLKRVLRGNAVTMIKKGKLTWQAVHALDIYTDDERRAAHIAWDALRAAGIPEPAPTIAPATVRRPYGTEEMFQAAIHAREIENSND